MVPSQLCCQVRWYNGPHGHDYVPPDDDGGDGDKRNTVKHIDGWHRKLDSIPHCHWMRPQQQRWECLYPSLGGELDDDDDDDVHADDLSRASDDDGRYANGVKRLRNHAIDVHDGGDAHALLPQLTPHTDGGVDDGADGADVEMSVPDDLRSCVDVYCDLDWWAGA